MKRVHLNSDAEQTAGAGHKEKEEASQGGSDARRAGPSPRGGVGQQDPEGTTWHGALQPKVCAPLPPRCAALPGLVRQSACCCRRAALSLARARSPISGVGEGKGIRQRLSATAPGHLSCYRKRPRNNWRLFRGSRATLPASLLPSESARDTRRFAQAHVGKRPSTFHFKSKD